MITSLQSPISIWIIRSGRSSSNIGYPSQAAPVSRCNSSSSSGISLIAAGNFSLATMRPWNVPVSMHVILPGEFGCGFYYSHRKKKIVLRISICMWSIIGKICKQKITILYSIYGKIYSYKVRKFYFVYLFSCVIVENITASHGSVQFEMLNDKQVFNISVFNRHLIPCSYKNLRVVRTQIMRRKRFLVSVLFWFSSIQLKEISLW